MAVLNLALIHNHLICEHGGFIVIQRPGLTESKSVEVKPQMCYLDTLLPQDLVVEVGSSETRGHILALTVRVQMAVCED